MADLGGFLERYYSSAIDQMTKEEKEDWIILRIEGPHDSVIEMWTEGAEVTIIFSESHWHIDDYNDPCDYSTIYENTIDGVMEVLQEKTGTYSCWSGGEAIGDASFGDCTSEQIIESAQGNFKAFDEIRIKRWANELEIIKV